MVSIATRLQLTSELTQGIEDIAEVTITIPLSSVTKNIHARMFIQTQLSLPELQNMKQLGQIFKANAYYYNDKYVKNVWFVKKTKVTVSPKERSMTLTLLPFNDSYENEAQTLSGLTEQKTKTGKTNQTTHDSTLNTVLSGEEQRYLEQIVKKAIGTKTDKVAQAKAIHKYYKNNHTYHLYCCMTSKSFKTLWNKKGHNCGDGARTLAYMLKCIGLEPYIMNGHRHFWIQVEIDGTTYYCDQAGAEGSHNKRNMGTSTSDSTVWGGASGGTRHDWNYGCDGPDC
jgi:hypothetical protein